MGSQMVSIFPEELSFAFELDKQSYCNLKLVNSSEHYVAFKIKTTAPKKYFVRPNTGVIQPWDSVVILVTLQAQREYPPDMQCKDKFLVQSARVPPNIDPDEIPPETFNKDGERKVEECKLKVVYTAPVANGPRSLEDHLLFHSSMSRSSRHTVDSNSMHSVGSSEESQAMVHLREERDAALQRHRKLQQELEMLKKSQLQRRASFSLKLIIMVGLVGILIGYLLSLACSIRSSEKTHDEL
ncbi:Vesicle-associated protein 2-1 [Nymphaea thermarum]|nr:Vesicle-associated protein 2-1 [Nymphaea thermarum]